MCFDPLDIPPLMDPNASFYHQKALEMVRKYRIPGSNNADAPMRMAAAAGEWPRVDPEQPEPGYYRVRLEPRGPFYPCRFFYTVGCSVNGLIVSPWDYWLQAAKHPISKEEYEALEAWCHEF